MDGPASADALYDVFVSYAHADDEIPAGAARGWVTTLAAELNKVLRRKIGGQGGRTPGRMEAAADVLAEAARWPSIEVKASELRSDDGRWWIREGGDLSDQ